MRRFQTILIILALGFYVWFVRQLGFERVGGYLKLAGVGVLLSIVLEALPRVINTLGWRATITDYPSGLSFPRMFSARIAGEAIDYVTPAAQLGGHFVTAIMVRRYLHFAAALATVIVAGLAEALGQIGFMVIAFLLTARLVAAIEGIFWPMIGALAITIALAGGFLFVQLRQPFTWLWRAATRFKVPMLSGADIKEASAEADALLSEFYSKHRARLFLSTLCFVVAWSMGVIEVYLLMFFLGQPVTLGGVLLIDALGLLIERMTFMIPAKLVGQEGGKELILSLMGYPPGVGFALGLLRRIKEMVWVGFGLTCLAIHRMVSEPPSVKAASAPGSALAE